MRVNIHHRIAGLSKEADVALRRLAAFALGRFATRINELSLRISDVNGPRGGVGFSCLARVRMSRPAIEVVATAEADDPILGAARALDKARNRVARSVERSWVAGVRA